MILYDAYVCGLVVNGIHDFLNGGLTVTLKENVILGTSDWININQDLQNTNIDIVVGHITERRHKHGTSHNNIHINRWRGSFDGRVKVWEKIFPVKSNIRLDNPITGCASDYLLWFCTDGLCEFLQGELFIAATTMQSGKRSMRVNKLFDPRLQLQSVDILGYVQS